MFNGMIGDLMSGQIDLILTSLTMTLERSQAVQYLPPIGREKGALLRNILLRSRHSFFEKAIHCIFDPIHVLRIVCALVYVFVCSCLCLCMRACVFARVPMRMRLRVCV